MSLSCGNKRGELIGVKQKKWFPEKPYGMTLVEGGAFIMGKQDDVTGAAGHRTEQPCSRHHSVSL